MKQIRVAVIGSGYWGPNLIRNFVELPISEVVAVADLNEERLAHIKNRYPKIAVTKNYHDLLSMSLDAVVVATPPATHFQIARECLQNNLSVLVEKPFTLNSRDAQELIDLAAARDLTLMVGHTFEYNPAVRTLKSLIHSGELGSVYYVNAVRVSLGLYQRGLDVLWDLAPHDISILLYLLEQEPVKVAAQGAACVFKDVHDVAYLHMAFPGGVLAHVHVSWLDPCKLRRITIVGSQKMAVYDDVEPVEKIKIYDKGLITPPFTDTLEEFQLSYRYRFGDVVIPHIDSTEPLRMECLHFAESILGRTEPQSNGLVGLKVVRVMEAAERSLKNGGNSEPMVRATRHLPAEAHIELSDAGIHAD